MYNGECYQQGRQLKLKDPNTGASRQLYKSHQGDTIHFTLDMDEGTLSIKVNDTDYGVVFTGLTGEVHPGVAFYHSNAPRRSVVLKSLRSEGIQTLPSILDSEAQDPILTYRVDKSVTNRHNVRSGPGLSFSSVDELEGNAVVSVYEVQGDWLRLNPRGDRWTLWKGDSQQYLKVQCRNAYTYFACCWIFLYALNITKESKFSVSNVHLPLHTHTHTH